MGQDATGEVVELIGTVGLLISAFRITDIGRYFYAPPLAEAILAHCHSLPLLRSGKRSTHGAALVVNTRSIFLSGMHSHFWSRRPTSDAYCSS